MRAYFEDIYSYHHWANDKVLDTMSGATAVPPLAITLFSHLLNAHCVWLDRIENQPDSYAVWQDHPMADLKSLAHQVHQQTLSLLQSERYGPDFQASVSYQNSKGVSFENTVQEILTHVANHTTHHRGQVARELRIHDIAPPATDYIVCKRTPTPE